MVKDKRRYIDRREYLIKAVYARRKKLREMAIAYKGGKCEICGYIKCIDALEFHHIDPAKKDFNISNKGYTRSWDRVKAELDKCMILCANCHRELHSKLAASNGNAGVISGLSQGNPEITSGQS
jgi:5-methylcytosine-specific restriction endonuclease McrA